MSGKKRDSTLFLFFNKKSKNEHPNIPNNPNDLDVIEDADKLDAIIHSPNAILSFLLLSYLVSYFFFINYFLIPWYFLI